MGTFTYFTNNEDPDDKAALHQGLVNTVKVKKIFRKKIHFFLDYYLTHLDMYNGLSQVY